MSTSPFDFATGEDRAAAHRARSSVSFNMVLPYLGLTVLAAALTLVAATQVALGVAVILQPWEVDYGEAMVYDHAARLVRGESPYQSLDRPPYTVAAYTPLYYAIAAGLRLVLGPGFGPGRVLSLIAGLVAAGLVGYLASRRTGTRWAGAFAALLFLALGLPGHFSWWAVYRVDFLGVALSLGAVTTLVGGTTRRRLVLAGLLAALALLTKQTFIAAALAGTVWLLRRDRRILVFLSTCLPVVIGTCLVLEITTGAFLANVVFANTNPFHFEALKGNLAVFVLCQGGPLAAAALYLRDRWRRWQEEEKLLVYYWAGSMLPVLGLGKVGANQNYWIEFAATTALLATIGVWARLSECTMRRDRHRAVVPIVLLGVTVLWVTHLVGVSARNALGEPWLSQNAIAEFSELVEHVRSEPADVLASSLDVVVLADRPISFEPYIFSILFSQGRWDPAPLVRHICAGEIGLLVLHYPLESGGERGLGLHGYAGWPAPILGALRSTMVLQSKAAGRFLYVPRTPTPNAQCQLLAVQDPPNLDPVVTREQRRFDSRAP